MKKRDFFIFFVIIFMILNIPNTAMGVGLAKADKNFAVVGEYYINEGFADSSFAQRQLSFNEGYFFIRKIIHNSEKGNYTTSFSIPGDTGDIYYVEKDEIVKKSLAGLTKLPTESAIYIKTNKYSYLISQAYSFRELGDKNIERVPNIRDISIKKDGKGYTISYSIKNKPALRSIIWAIGSEKELITEESAIYKDIKKVSLDNDALLYYDGYYYRSAKGYEPYSKNSYFNNPSMYIVSFLLDNDKSVAGAIMSNSLLTIARDNMKEEGYFSLGVVSKWLKDDYGIGKNYFDTRWNADIGMSYLKAYKTYANDEYKADSIKLLSYYMKHIDNNHFETRGKDGELGYLVCDYSGENQSKKTHSSLNHQLMAINWFLSAYESFGEKSYKDYADKMLRGIEHSCDKWIKDNGDLHYAYIDENNMGYEDYVELTYNDLLLTKKLLKEISGIESKEIDKLIEVKGAWVEKNSK